MARSLQLFPPFAPAAVAAPQGDSRPAAHKPQLWLAICLPAIAFESLPGAATRGPTVVVEPQRGQIRVVAANAAARNVGIEPGGQLSAALALSASLQAVERAPSCERASLASLAAWAQRLTSLVSIEPPEILLLEVAGSLKLFGSLEAIKAKLADELARRCLTFRFGAAPNATAAAWLARAGGGDVLAAHELTGRLGTLSVAVTEWPLTVQALLRDLGVLTLGECLRLPRDGFARRVGHTYLDELDRSLGRQPDLRAEFKAPVRWSSRVELFEESVDGAVFLAAIESLLDALTIELRARQAQISSLRVVFEHLHRPPTYEHFDLLEPTHERDRLLHLVEDRLERCILPVPAIALQLRSGRLLSLELREPDLFTKVPVEAIAQALLERLQERFGSTAVYGVCAVAEHRPERAWAKSRQWRDARPLRGPSRPLWLLPEPVPLSSPAARYHYRGSLELRSEPERIESGWWDDQDIGRDYYTAVSSNGQRLWIFRDRPSHAWYLHGLFG